jgi:hypothetical protein
MVMAAICVIIMAVLASVFQTGIDAMRQVRSSGDMMDQLRAAGVVMKRDLQGDPSQPVDHFLPDPLPGQRNERRRVSEYLFDQMQPPPRGGYMRIFSPWSTPEGPPPNGVPDADGLYSYRATNHTIQFTTILSGGTDQNLFSATVAQPTPNPPVTLTSPAAEIAYFLDTSPANTTYTNGPGSPPLTTPLYRLIRRQRLVATNPTDLATFQAALNNDPTLTAQEVISARVNSPGPPVTWTVNSLQDLTVPSTRLGIPAVLNMPRAGDDVLLSSVISFELKVLWDSGGPDNLPYPAAGPTQQYAFKAFLSFPRAFVTNTDNPFDNLPPLLPPVNPPSPPGSSTAPTPFNTFNNSLVGQQLFDTWYVRPPTSPTNWNTLAPNADGLPAWIRVKSIQIRVRVFDPKLKNARQTSFVMDL